MKALFVTGGARGIGFAIAERFYREGWAVTLTDVNEEQLAEAVAKLENANSNDKRVMSLKLDVTDYDAFHEAIAEHQRQWGRLDLLVNNAGLGVIARFEKNSPADHARMIQVNYTGVVNGVHAGFDALKETAAREGEAQIMNLCSASSCHGIPEHAVYGGTKAAVKNFTEALDIEFKEYGIKVRDILPEYVATPMVMEIEDAPGAVDALGVNLVAADVGETAWNAYRRKGIHFAVTNKFAVVMKIVAIFPSYARKVFGGAFYNKYPAGK